MSRICHHAVKGDTRTWELAWLYHHYYILHCHTATVSSSPNLFLSILYLVTYHSVSNHTLQWWATRFLPPLAEVISVPQHAAIWRYLDLEGRPTDKEVFPSLVRHCGTRCRSLCVTHLWQWRSSAHIWRLFCFAEHIVLCIAPSWQFRL